MKYYCFVLLCLSLVAFSTKDINQWSLPYHLSDFEGVKRQFGYQSNPRYPGFINCFPRKNTGIVIQLKEGAPILAISDGVVIDKCDTCKRGFGNFIMIKHTDSLSFRYYHLSKLKVSIGQEIKQGEQIAISGNSGTTTINGVGINVYKDSTTIDPLVFLGIDSK